MREIEASCSVAEGAVDEVGVAGTGEDASGAVAAMVDDATSVATESGAGERDVRLEDTFSLASREAALIRFMASSRSSRDLNVNMMSLCPLTSRTMRWNRPSHLRFSLGSWALLMSCIWKRSWVSEMKPFAQKPRARE